MSWALEEWKEGLPTRALQKIQELEGQLDKLKKEKQQRQFQLDTLDAALQKQKQKVENEKNEATNLKRENQRLMEICENLEKMKQKISHELQVKESQVNFQEGQLNSGKKQIEKLEQELKRCKSELERSQQTVQSADVSLHSCNTPQKPFATPLTPSQYYSGSKYEDLKDKYNKEVEERKRLEAEVKALQTKKASQATPQTTMNYRDIARHQASSSVFSWQQETTPSRLSSTALKTPNRRDVPHSFGKEEVIPSRSTLHVGRDDANGSFSDNSSSSSLLDQLKAQNQDLRSKINELELRLQGQEKEMKGQANKFQELQLQLEKTKLELIEKEKVLNKNKDELVRTTAQYDQAANKCTVLEQKLKKLTEDLSCQRQNAESTRCSLEQKIKEKEKELREELSHQQRSFQTLDQECTQMKARLTQELQQAKNMLNVLQAELDKVTSVKLQLERNLEECKQKLSRTEQALQARQITEDELRKSNEEMKKENGLLRSQSEQRAREVCHLEEELRKVKLCFDQSQNFAEEMKAKNASQEIMLRDLQEKINQQENSLALEKLKIAVADLEKQRDCSQDLLKKREHHIEQLNDKLSKLEDEFKTLLSTSELKGKEYEELKEEKTQYSHWKSESEKLISQMESEKGNLQSKINHLETCLKTQQIKNHEYNERVKTLEVERENLNVEIRNLYNVLDSKTAELETQKQAYIDLQQKAEFSDQKHQKEIENMCLKLSQLTKQIEDLEQKLQFLSSEIVTKDQHYSDLCAEYESLRGLLTSRDSSLQTNGDKQRSCLALELQPVMNNTFANPVGEQRSLFLEGSECHITVDQSPKNSAALQNRVDSLEFLESQKQMNSDLQKQCEELVQIKEEIEENLSKAEHMHESFVAETSQRISKLQEDASVHQNAVAETLVAFENKEKELQLLKEKLEAEQAEIRELKKSNHLLEDSLKELQLLSQTLNVEKKEMSSIISLSKKEIEELARENGTLKEMNEALNQDKMNLLQKSENFSNRIEEREKSISELSNQYEQERLVLLQRWEEMGHALEDLNEKYEAAKEKNATLECLLNECTSVCENRKNELEQLKETFAKEHQEFVTKLAFSEERNEKLILELGTVQQALRSEITDIKNSSKSEADSLKQEIMTLKTEQNKMQQEVSDLLQENQRLMQLTASKSEHQLLELEPIRDSAEDTQNEMDKSHPQDQMDLDVKDISPDSYKTQLVKLEALLRNAELKLKESEKEKESLQQELQSVRELETRSSENSLSQDTSGLKDGEVVDAEEKYFSVLHDLSTSHSDNAHLQCSLQVAMNKLSELEKMCEILQAEKLELAAELNDSRSECITATSKMAEEVEKLVNEVKILNGENGHLQSELGKEVSGSEFIGQQDDQRHVSLSPRDDSDFSEQLTLSHKEVQGHFSELQEKFSCLQSEHTILQEQHCQISSKMSELQSYIDTLKAENSALSLNLKNLQNDLVKPGPEEGHILSLSFSSPRPTNLGESFYKDALDQTGDLSLLHALENVSADQSTVDEVSCTSLGEESLTDKEISSAPMKSVEELEVLCQLYLQSLKNLEEKMESQGSMKNKEIEELEQLLSSERNELDCLRKQYLSENEQWQQKLTSVTLEMESKLAAEKKQTEHLSHELEVARLQLQGLDLSSRSLLGTDVDDAIRGQLDSCDIKGPEENTSETTEEIPKEDTEICDKDIQQSLSLETGQVIEAETVQLTREPPGEQSSKMTYGTLVEGKTQCHSECSSEFSFSTPNASVPIDFLENQVFIQNLQLQVKETSNENLRLLHTVEDRDKKVESLLNEIKELDLKLGLQEVQLKSKIETCIQLEKMVVELKKEKSSLGEKLESLPYDSQVLCQRLESSEVLGSHVEMDPEELSYENVKDTAAKESGSWKDRCVDLEDELNRMKSEKATVEHHAISVEADVDRLQAEKLCLENDNENKQKVITSLEEELSAVTSERNRFHEALDSMSKEHETLDQMSEKMKEKIKELESLQAENLRHIQTVEAEVKDKTELLQTLSSEVSKLSEDKAHLQEQLRSGQEALQALSLEACELESQIRQLNQEKESLTRESESLQARLSESDHEKLTASKALEVALMEKGEFAVRLSSTQEEVHQLRRGIEKLKVRIEDDEKKHLQVTKELKASQRESDLLKDKVENLEKELQMSEENQELVILDAENAKAEVETLKAQIEPMTESLRVVELDLAAVRSEKENLTKQLQEKHNQVAELDALVSSFKSLLEEKEQARIQMEESKSELEMLKTQLKEFIEEVAALCDDQEMGKNMERNLDLTGEEMPQPRSSIEKLKVRLEADKNKQAQVLEQLKGNQHHVDLLQDRVGNLEQELEFSAKKQEHAISEAENSKAEVETLKAEIQQRAQTLRDLELELLNTKSEKENLTKELEKEQERVSELETLRSSFENLWQEKEFEKVQMKEDTEKLQMQLIELNEKMVALCTDQATYKTKEQNLSAQLDSLELEKTQLLQDLDEAKNKCMTFQSSVNDLIQEVEDGKQKLEKKEGEVRRLKDQLCAQEQLVTKLSQLEEEQGLWQKQKLELGNLTMELEQKVQGLQSKNDALQDTFSALQNSYKDLESELEFMKMEKIALVEQVNTMTVKETELQREMQEMVRKTTELKEELSGERNRLTEELKVLSEELQSSKLDHLNYVNQLKKENERAQGKIKLLLKSCKQQEEEKKTLQKEVSQLEAAQKQKTGTSVDANVDELVTQIKELKETLEDKTKEAEDYLEKYCSLLISHEKLENAKEMLETQVAFLNSKQSRHNLRSSPVLNTAVQAPSPVPAAAEKKLSGRQGKASGKRQRSSGILENGGGSVPSTPETFCKKSRKAIKGGICSAEDEDEFEPEGLPEVVKKGFADIPTGKTSPYVLRRTTMATRTSPRLAAQKLTPSPLSLGKENPADSSKPTAGGSRSQKVKVAQHHPGDSGTGPREPTMKSLSINNLPERSLTDSLGEGLKAKQGRLAPSPEAQPTPQRNENCHVQ
ncbi:centromere protein F [Perognathus longimembris pacificus]|uniref:centromere protein F n=1 Tax=Perognathus longimembris pacificus TaxID=214514 RepID=UPI002019F8C5|nr:centromere protein F [Perognathus longimembris pacificus]XP_048213235.1 centromere protein F [Perognathus longimembris pacificus]